MKMLMEDELYFPSLSFLSLFSFGRKKKTKEKEMGQEKSSTSDDIFPTTSSDL
jgi:hypothetical protein